MFSIWFCLIRIPAILVFHINPSIHPIDLAYLNISWLDYSWTHSQFNHISVVASWLTRMFTFATLRGTSLSIHYCTYSVLEPNRDNKDYNGNIVIMIEVAHSWAPRVPGIVLVLSSNARYTFVTMLLLTPSWMDCHRIVSSDLSTGFRFTCSSVVSTIELFFINLYLFVFKFLSQISIPYA